MSMRSGLFDSTEIVETPGGYPRGNKAESADFFARYFSQFIGNGVYISPPTNYAVLSSSALTVQIRPGSAFINGYFCFDDEIEYKTFSADSVRHEYWLVLRLDTDEGEITKTWYTDPVLPPPTRSGSIYELVLAKVEVGPSVSVITDSMISDYRGDTSKCGYVRSLVDGIGANVEYADTAGALSSLLPVESGGTGAADAASALRNLGALPLSGGSMTGTLSAASDTDYAVYKVRNIALSATASTPTNTGDILGVYS